MTFPAPVAQPWDDLQAVRAEVLAEVRPLSPRPAHGTPGARDHRAHVHRPPVPGCPPS